jgi:flagellar basal-body rod modification protein FlgD
MTSAINSATQTSASGSSTTQNTTNAGADALAQKDTFLKLLVAQIKNQNPLDPMDGLQFVSQLAQFSELEQIMQVRADLDALVGALPQDGTSPATGTDSQEN